MNKLNADNKIRYKKNSVYRSDAETYGYSNRIKISCKR